MAKPMDLQDLIGILITGARIRPGGPERAPCTSAARLSSPQATHAWTRPRAAATSHASDVLPTPGGPTRQSSGDGVSGFARRPAT